MQLILAALLAIPALAEIPKPVSFGVPVTGELPVNKERDELWGANPEGRFWDLNDPTGEECIDRKHAECLLSHYNQIWSGDFTQLPATISQNFKYYYNGTGDTPTGQPAATAANYEEYIKQSVLNDEELLEVSQYETLYYFIGCQTVAQHWEFKGVTTGNGMVNGIQLPAGLAVEFRGIDLIRLTKEDYEGVEMWMLLEAVTSEDDQNAQGQLEEAAAKMTAMGGGGGAKGRKRVVRSAKMPLMATE